MKSEMPTQELDNKNPDYMKTQILEKKISEWIKDNYSATYIGLLEVMELHPGFQLKLGIPSYLIPTYIALDCETPEEFLDFVYKELKERNYMRQYVYRVYREDLTREE